MVQCDLSLATELRVKHRALPRRRGKSQASGRTGETLWDLSLQSLTARLSIKLHPAEARVSAKLEGWPNLDIRWTDIVHDLLVARATLKAGGLVTESVNPSPCLTHYHTLGMMTRI